MHKSPGRTITVALAIDHTPGRVILKFIDTQADGVPRKGTYDARQHPKIGTIYLSRPSDHWNVDSDRLSQMNGMLISESYRGRGLAKGHAHARARAHTHTIPASRRIKT